MRLIWERPDSDFEWVMGVNFYGIVHGIRAFVNEKTIWIGKSTAAPSDGTE